MNDTHHPVQSMIIEDTARRVTLEVLVVGDGDTVVLVPSAMRGAADFADLQVSLAENGFRSLALNPRGIGASSPPDMNVSLRDLADDMAFVTSKLGGGSAHLVGHALGNIIVRATASYRPEVPVSVTVMPCGGDNLGAFPVKSEVLEAFARCHDQTLSKAERQEALSVAFFARGNDPRSWLDGWWPSSTLGAVIMASDPAEWRQAGSAPILIMQPLEDAMTPTSAGREAAAAFGERATYVEIPQCGHAILPEQPEVVAANLIAFLRGTPFRKRRGEEGWGSRFDCARVLSSRKNQHDRRPWPAFSSNTARERRIDMNVSGKTAIVTGASRGIGKQIAIELGRQGAKVVVAARTVVPHRRVPGTISETVEAIQAVGGEALAVQTDLKDPMQVQDLVDRTLERFGSVSVLVNNAADTSRIATRRPFVDASREDWLSQFDTNLHGPFSLMQAVLPSMISAHEGVIINVSSGAAQFVPISDEYGASEARRLGERYAYAASKAALNRLGNALAAECYAAGIAIMMVCPGSTRTELVDLMSEVGTTEGSAGPIEVPVKTILHMITCDQPMQYSGQFFHSTPFAVEHGLL